jgi:20S proteasome subunit beta 1
MKKTPYLLGTTLVVLKYDNGIMIGTDSQTSSGKIIINRAASKVTILSEKTVICRSGSSSDSQYMGILLKNLNFQYFLEREKNLKIRSIVQIIRNICYRERKISNYGFICCGWDSVHGGQIYSITQGGSIIKQNFALSGSGSIFLNSYLDSFLVDKLKKDNCRNILLKALSFAVYKDSNSGGIIRICDISRSGMKKQSYLPYLRIKNTFDIKFSKSILI